MLLHRRMQELLKKRKLAAAEAQRLLIEGERVGVHDRAQPDASQLACGTSGSAATRVQGTEGLASNRRRVSGTSQRRGHVRAAGGVPGQAVRPACHSARHQALRRPGRRRRGGAAGVHAAGRRAHQDARSAREALNLNRARAVL